MDLRIPILLSLALLGTAACKQGAPGEVPPLEEATPSTPFRNANTEVAYVGNDACFSCHEDAYLGYQEHGMAQSFYRLAPEKVVEDFSGQTLYHAASGFYYTMLEDGGRYYQEEYRLGRAGEKTHQLRREMVYVVGSGSAARTYLTEDHGRLYEMPVTWYTQTQKWDFSPGYDKGNKRFDRLVPDRCMACHNSYPASVPYVEGKYDAVPLGIGCERCHGPGAQHVEARLADPDPPAAVDSTIVNPAHLPLGLRLDVCQQCHLHTSVSLLRAGRTAFDYRPSQPLDDYMALFAVEAPENPEEIDVISHADRMRQSACFIGTQAQGQPMECVTCHNPHEGFRDQGPAYFNDTCLTCHPSSQLATRFEAPDVQATHLADAANCITCHMPKVRAEGTPHASFTDHWIRVTERDAAPDEAAAVATATLQPYFGRDESGPEADVYRGMAYVVYGLQTGDDAAVSTGIAQLGTALAQQPDHDEAHYLHGFGLLQLGRIEEAIPALEEAVRLDADVPERLNALAQAYEAAGRDAATITRLYRRALSIQPALAEVWVNYGRFLEAQGQIDEALQAYRRAAAEHPWLATAHYNLGTAYLRQGAFEAAEAALQQALTLQPQQVEALGNLGLMYASQGDLDAARRLFEEAVAVAPENPVALANLGTYHLNANDEAQAIALLTRAVAADPGYVDALANLALAHLRQGTEAEARRYAQQALSADPANALAQQILAAL